MKKNLFNTSFFILIYFIPFFANGQFVTVSGNVSNKSDGTHLENVSIYESGSIIGTITDKSGYYKLMLPPGTVNMSATLHGYHDFKMQMTVSNDTVYSIQLTPVIDKKSTSDEEKNVQAMKNTDNKSNK